MSDIRQARKALASRIREGDGKASPSERRSAFNNGGLAEPLGTLVDKVARHIACIPLKKSCQDSCFIRSTSRGKWQVLSPFHRGWDSGRTDDLRGGVIHTGWSSGSRADSDVARGSGRRRTHTEAGAPKAPPPLSTIIAGLSIQVANGSTKAELNRTAQMALRHLGY
jgi:hypothetical protein